MVNLGRHDGDYSRRIPDFMPVVDTGAASGDYFVGFQLRVMDVVENGLVWGYPYQMEAVCASGLFGRQNVFQFYACKCG